MTDNNNSLQKGCQALDSDGKQCTRKIIKYIKYHGDGEIYSYNFDNPKKDMTWVIVGVCKLHDR